MGPPHNLRIFLVYIFFEKLCVWIWSMLFWRNCTYEDILDCESHLVSWQTMTILFSFNLRNIFHSFNILLPRVHYFKPNLKLYSRTNFRLSPHMYFNHIEIHIHRDLAIFGYCIGDSWCYQKLFTKTENGNCELCKGNTK